MSHEIETLLTQYETGRLTRRELLGVLALATASAPAIAAAPIGKVTQVNHVSIFVPDVKKSVAFYQDVLGLPLLTRQDAGINLNAGSGFLGIYPAPAGGSGSINHVCFGMENFDADAALKMLTDRGIKANIRMRGETKELYSPTPMASGSSCRTRNTSVGPVCWATATQGSAALHPRLTSRCRSARFAIGSVPIQEDPDDPQSPSCGRSSRAAHAAAPAGTSPARRNRPRQRGAPSNSATSWRGRRSAPRRYRTMVSGSVIGWHPVKATLRWCCARQPQNAS